MLYTPTIPLSNWASYNAKMQDRQDAVLLEVSYILDIVYKNW